MRGTPGLRERKKARTRQEIAACAFTLAVDRGLSGFTVDELAEAADVSPRTVFNYFPSKEEAVVAHSDEGHADFAAALAARPADEPPLEALRRAIVGQVEQRSRAALKEQRALICLLHDEPTLQPHLMGSFARTERMLAEVVAQHSNTDAVEDTYPRLVAACVMALMRTCLVRWAEQPRASAASLARALDDAFDELAAGLPDPRSR